jgi:hypothetical protein
MSFPAALPGLTDPVVLAMPDRLVPSAWLGHIPFAMWLVNVHRPGVTVELGVHNGASLCAMVQAAAAIGHDGRFHGVDHWLGDEHAGTHAPDVYWDLMAYHEPRLRDRSTLMRIGFDEATAHFGDAGVDLLHIDGLHTYEAVRHDFESWLPKMSPRGVVLFHDTCVRQGGFGVWRLWDELSLRYPSFGFSHSHGLGVLYVGSDPVPDWMATMAAIQPAAAGDAVRAYFNALGDAVETEFRSRSERAELARLHAELEGLRGHAHRLQAGLDAHARALAGANAVVSSHAGRIAGLQDELGGRDRTIASLTSELARVAEEHAQIEREVRDARTVMAA